MTDKRTRREICERWIDTLGVVSPIEQKLRALWAVVDLLNIWFSTRHDCYCVEGQMEAENLVRKAFDAYKAGQEGDE